MKLLCSVVAVLLVCEAPIQGPLLSGGSGGGAGIK